MTATTETTTGVGRVARVTGPVVDVEFPVEAMPELFNALNVDVSFDGSPNHQVKLTSGGSTFRIMGIGKEEFPPLPEFGDEKAYSLEQGELATMLRSVAYAQSTDETRYILNGVYFNFKDGNWKITGLLSMGSVPAAALTLWFLSTLHTDTSALNAIIKQGLAVVLILTALAILFKSRLQAFASRHAGDHYHLSDRSLNTLTVLTGVVLGALAGALTSLLKILADPYDQLPAITFWLLGSLSGLQMDEVWAIAPVVASAELGAEAALADPEPAVIATALAGTAGTNAC